MTYGPESECANHYTTAPHIAFVIVQVSAPYKDRHDIYREKAKLDGHGYTGVLYVAIQLCHAVPRD